MCQTPVREYGLYLYPIFLMSADQEEEKEEYDDEADAADIVRDEPAQLADFVGDANGASHAHADARDEAGATVVATAPTAVPAAALSVPAPHVSGFVGRALDDNEQSHSDNGVPPTPRTPTPDVPGNPDSPVLLGTSSPARAWEGSRHYEFVVHPNQPATRLFGTVLERLRRRRAGEVLHLCAEEGQRVTIGRSTFSLVMCFKIVRIFYVWVVNAADEEYIALAKDVVSVESLPESSSQTEETRRIQVFFVCLLNTHVCTCVHLADCGRDGQTEGATGEPPHQHASACICRYATCSGGPQHFTWARRFRCFSHPAPHFYWGIYRGVAFGVSA